MEELELDYVDIDEVRDVLLRCRKRANRVLTVVASNWFACAGARRRGGAARPIECAA